MTPQTNPKYADVTSVANPEISRALIAKYHDHNVIWPIVLIEGNTIRAYLYERTEKNKINAPADSRPQSISGIGSYFLDYSTEPRYITPEWKLLRPFVQKPYACSYDYITTSPYSTVDIDYAWKCGAQWRGIELTTFWVEFVNKARAEDLIAKLCRRPSWRGPHGAHGLRKIVDAAQDLQITPYMVCVNTVGRVSNQYKTNGNTYRFPLSHRQIDRLVQCKVPEDGVFCTFSELLEWF